MDWLRVFFSRFASLFQHRKLDAELDEELRAHIELAIAEHVAQGVPLEDARIAAVREFGGLAQTREAYRIQRGLPWLEQIARDIRFAARQLRKSPGFAIAVILMLALGIGANTTVFSIVDAVLLRPLPYAHPERLIEIWSMDPHRPDSTSVSYPDFFDWRARSRSFDHMVSYRDVSYTLTGVGRAVNLDGQATSWDLLPMLGVRPELGRGFLPAEEKRGTRVLLLSHALWQSQFGSDPSVIGRVVHLSGTAFTVIGVMPASFRFPIDEPLTSFWTTLAVEDDPTDPNPMIANRGAHFMAVMGRLKPGVSAAQAQQEMSAIAAELARQYPDSNSQRTSARVEPMLNYVLGDTRLLMFVVLGAVALVLLIACGNIANLFLTRIRERQREIAVRAALGARRARIVGQLMTESLLLSLVGGLAGCALAYAAVPGALALLGTSVPRAANAHVDPRVLGFAFAAATLSALLFGLVPAITASKTDFSGALQLGGARQVGGRDWLRKAVIVAQVALGIVLTAAAGLLVSSFVTLTHTSEGFNPDHLLTFSFETKDQKTRSALYAPYFERLRALPGVESVAGTMLLPMTDNSIHISFENPEKPVPKGSRPSALTEPVTPGYFKTMQTPILEGRDFTNADNEHGAPVMIVNEAFARQFFPGEDPIGKRLKPGAGNGDPHGPAWRRIVGVVDNVRHSATDRAMAPEMYLPAYQLTTWCCLSTVMRTSVAPLSLERPARQVVASIDPDIPTTQVSIMRDLLSLQLAQPRFAVVLLGAFAVLALVLTVIGLYGVMAYSVTRQTREIGLRLALGAQRTAVVRAVLRDAAMLLGAGIVLGLAAALLSSPILGNMLYGTGPRNPLLLAVVIVCVALAGLLAAFFPAARAAAIDPMRALRTE